jgi:aspartyl-tRNA synthetase
LRLKRSHYCGAVDKSLLGNEVILSGWVNSIRDLGGFLFLTIRDRHGVCQGAVDPNEDKSLFEKISLLRSEDVISIRGLVQARPDDMVNKSMKTGGIELKILDVEVLNKAKITPFEISDKIEINEENRLKYRYLDIRRPSMQEKMIMRHKVAKVTRDYFDENDFIEIETPILMKSTPEGARDFLVPSRMHQGEFYALPQSPQTYKQLLMVSGFDRYFQIVKCFRDEDLRKDRQPEFTQIDVEMSFMNQEEILQIAEGLVIEIFQKVMSMDLQRNFPRLTYKEAMDRYGSDKPDTRFDIELIDVKECFSKSDFKVFKSVIDTNGEIKAISVPNAAHFSRKQVDKVVDYAKKFRAKGIVHFKAIDGKLESPVNKFLTETELENLWNKIKPEDNDLILISCDVYSVVHQALGELRIYLANELKLIPENKWNFLWVTDFPMFEYDEEEKRYYAMHHPFTRPNVSDMSELDKNPSDLNAEAYDLVLNGNEIAGGSLRIYEKELQSKVFDLLSISKEEADEKFGFLMNAFEYGAPPHGGFAFGFDRLIMLLSGADSIREVIAFPKTQRGQSLMDNSPSEIDEKQLKELHLRVLDHNN